MKCFCTLVIGLVIFAPIIISARHIGRQHSHHRSVHTKLALTTKEVDVEMLKPDFNLNSMQRRHLVKHRKPDTLQIAGSSLPDCSHACGSCTPCRLVMVSFVCSSLAEAETCPMAYKCMCNNKSYPVP